MHITIGIESDERHLAEAERCAQKIFELEPESVLGFRLSGLVQFHKGNAQAGLANLKRTLEIDPNDTDALLWSVGFYSTAGNVAEAQLLATRLVEVDPLTPVNHLMATLPFYYKGQFAEAAEQMKVAFDMEPENPVFIWHYCLWLLAAGREPEAFALLNEQGSGLPDDFPTRLPYFMKYALKKDKERALQIASEDFRTAARNDLQYSVFMAEGLALLDEKDESLDWLESAVDRGFINYPFLAEYDPFLKNIRNASGFKQLMKRVKYEWENFEV